MYYKKDNGEGIGFDKPIIVKIEDADIINYAYSYSDGMGGAGSVKKPQKTISAFAKSIMDAIEKDENEVKSDWDII